jgi:hypothetical protein
MGGKKVIDFEVTYRTFNNKGHLEEVPFPLLMNRTLEKTSKY